MNRKQAEVKLKSEDLKRLYSAKLGIDISRFIASADVRLSKDSEYGFGRFIGCSGGDSQFYSDLMDRLGYDDGEKSEFKAAAKYVNSGQSVLDVGCGPGKFSGHCTGSYRGIELNPHAVRDAQALGRNVLLEDLADQLDGAYDVVTLFQVLEHVDDPIGFFKEAARKVKQGGCIIVTTPNMDAYISKSVNHVLNYPPHHLSWWGQESLTNLLISNGFEKVVMWRERLQEIHTVDWLEAILNPAHENPIDFSLKAKIARKIARLLTHLSAGRLNDSDFIDGQCIMAVGRRVGEQ